MEFIASVSRSSGLEKDGSALKDYKVQEDYRAFIGEKLEAFWRRYDERDMEMLSESEARQKKDSQENILILLRKLREGLFSANRTDAFALEGYETSLYLSVIFDSPVQTTSILSHLIPDLYNSSASTGNRLTSALILCLHHLIASYPSQQSFHDQLKRLIPNFLERSSEAHAWIISLARSLRSINYVKFEELSRPSSFSSLIGTPPPSNQKASHLADNDLARDAVYALVKRLRTKARDKTWIVMRSAYREMSATTETREWLTRTLLLTPPFPGTKIVTMDEWMAYRSEDGHVRLKEGAEGKWLVNKPR
ncbi:hypothetical protein BV22DRAFT_1193358 [Leucogyrophana mollusca]|uniref:Uncharacterized protein n=1 Tax=Leucogyrophana mollusca TaxID=85980 RepID=A0ACB8BRB1_9AGAM|nr:hypothetical protein BV22DRAFT_1193358 [Leucogyrophana mollusca]